MNSTLFLSSFNILFSDTNMEELKTLKLERSTSQDERTSITELKYRRYTLRKSKSDGDIYRMSMANIHIHQKETITGSGKISSVCDVNGLVMDNSIPSDPFYMLCSIRAIINLIFAFEYTVYTTCIGNTYTFKFGTNQCRTLLTMYLLIFFFLGFFLHNVQILYLVMHMYTISSLTLDSYNKYPTKYIMTLENPDFNSKPDIFPGTSSEKSRAHLWSKEDMPCWKWSFLPGKVFLEVFPIQKPDSLNSYFQHSQYRDASVSMHIEWLRLQTFSSFDSINVRPIRLARSGFYHTGTSDEVQCYSCNVRRRHWAKGEDPDVVHRQISPNCPHITGGDDTNISIGRPEDTSSRTEVHASNSHPPGNTNANHRSVLANIRDEDTLPVAGSDPNSAPTRGYCHNALFLSGRGGLNTASVEGGIDTNQENPSVEERDHFNNVPPNSHVAQPSVPVSSPVHVPPSSESRMDTLHRNPSIQEQGNSNNVPQRSYFRPPWEEIPVPNATGQAPASSAFVAFPDTCQRTPTRPSGYAQRNVNSNITSQSGDSSNSSYPNLLNEYSNVQARPISNNVSRKVNTIPASQITGTPTRFMNHQTPSMTHHHIPSSSTTHVATSGSCSVSSSVVQKLTPLGVNFDRPKYPEYAVLTVRMSSYSGWSAPQTPGLMADAGFVYAGYADFTRCFFCGGGLKNWEEGDDPWLEHAKWFPKCAYLRQNKGDVFIQLVHQDNDTNQVRHHYMCT